MRLATSSPGAQTPKTPQASWGPGRWGSRSWLSRPSPRGTCRSLMLVWTGLAGITGGSTLALPGPLSSPDSVRESPSIQKVTILRAQRHAEWDIRRLERQIRREVRAVAAHLDATVGDRLPPSRAGRWPAPARCPGPSRPRSAGFPGCVEAPARTGLAPYGGTRTSTDRPGARSARTANSDRTASRNTGRSGVRPSSSADNAAATAADLLCGEDTTGRYDPQAAHADAGPGSRRSGRTRHSCRRRIRTVMIPGPAPAGQGKSDRKAVDVSTHRRAWKQRAGVVVALVAGALLAVPATPALAAERQRRLAGLGHGQRRQRRRSHRARHRRGRRRDRSTISLAGLPVPASSCAGGCGDDRASATLTEPFKPLRI